MVVFWGGGFRLPQHEDLNIFLRLIHVSLNWYLLLQYLNLLNVQSLDLSFVCPPSANNALDSSVASRPYSPHVKDCPGLEYPNTLKLSFYLDHCFNDFIYVMCLYCVVKNKML